MSTGDKTLDSAGLLESFWKSHRSIVSTCRDPLRNPLLQITSNWSHKFFSLFAFFNKNKTKSKSVIHFCKYALWRLYFYSKFVIHPQHYYCVWPPWNFQVVELLRSFGFRFGLFFSERFVFFLFDCLRNVSEVLWGLVGMLSHAVGLSLFEYFRGNWEHPWIDNLTVLRAPWSAILSSHHPPICHISLIRFLVSQDNREKYYALFPPFLFWSLEVRSEVLLVFFFVSFDSTCS